MKDIEQLPRFCSRCGASTPSYIRNEICPACSLRQISAVELMKREMACVAQSDLHADGMWALPAVWGKHREIAPSCDELRVWFPKLDILEMIGTGGMGAVYRARQPRLDRFVALKVLVCPSEKLSDFSLRFEREARVLARLNHPHIVSVHDFGEIDRTGAGLEPLYYILMEFVDGSDLNRLIGSAGVSQDKILRLVGQICEALQYAHDQGVTHRDIKPSNLLVDRRGNLKIADFGLAKLLRGDETLAMDLTLTGALMGTPRYMAPELWEASATVDHRADLYSLGVVLQDLLAKNSELGDSSSSLPIRSDGRRLGSVILKAVEREPTRRFQSATELREAVFHVVGSRRRFPTKVKILGAVALIGMILFAAFGSRFWQERVGGAARKVGGDLPISRLANSLPIPTAPVEPTFENSLGMKFVPVPDTDILLCIHETRKGDYARFAAEHPEIEDDWKNPTELGLPVSDHDDHPVVSVSWNDAKAFCAWLSERENRTYRLPTDREWSVAAGIADLEAIENTPEELHNQQIERYPWGNTFPIPKGAGNFGDNSLKEKLPLRSVVNDYLDGYPATAPVMSFGADRLGLYDLGGNAREWCEDWFNSDPEMGKVMRGSSWSTYHGPAFFLSHRGYRGPQYGHPTTGFRCVLEKLLP